MTYGVMAHIRTLRRTSTRKHANDSVDILQSGYTSLVPPVDASISAKRTISKRANDPTLLP